MNPGRPENRVLDGSSQCFQFILSGTLIIEDQSATWSNLCPSYKTEFHVINGKREWKTRQKHHFRVSRAFCETLWRVRGKGRRTPWNL